MLKEKIKEKLQYAWECKVPLWAAGLLVIAVAVIF